MPNSSAVTRCVTLHRLPSTEIPCPECVAAVQKPEPDIHLGKPSVDIECPQCGDTIRIDYHVIQDPDLPPNQIRLRPTYQPHQCAPTGGEA